MKAVAVAYLRVSSKANSGDGKTSLKRQAEAVKGNRPDHRRRLLTICKVRACSGAGVEPLTRHGLLRHLCS